MQILQLKTRCSTVTQGSPLTIPPERVKVEQDAQSFLKFRVLLQGGGGKISLYAAQS